MIVIIIVVIFLIILLLVLSNYGPKENILNEKTLVQQPTIDFSKYETNYYIMTQTELKFYRELKPVADKLGLDIFPQVDLERMIRVSDNNKSDRNRIKSRSIDYTLVSAKNCKIVCCIELDDYTQYLNMYKFHYIE